jgi:hypothetical protein
VSHEQERVPDRLAPRGTAAAEREQAQLLKSPHIVGLFCPYSRSLLTLVWSTQAQLLGFGRTPSLPVI